MRNVKLDDDKDIKGCISCYTGDRKYYGEQIDSLINKNKSYYSNAQYYILNQFK